MKKIIFIILLMFVLTGCSNTVKIDFNDKIDTKVEFSFTLDEYKANINDDMIKSNDELAKSSIEAILNDFEAFQTGNNDIFKENRLTKNNNYYSGEYEYQYTYSNFKESSIINSCFEHPIISETNTAIYVSLKGSSMCAPFKLSIKADNRMINQNSTQKNGDEYIWNINKTNNDVYFAINKAEMKSNSFNIMNIVYLILAAIFGIILFIFNKKYKRNNY